MGAHYARQLLTDLNRLCCSVFWFIKQAGPSRRKSEGNFILYHSSPSNLTLWITASHPNPGWNLKQFHRFPSHYLMLSSQAQPVFLKNMNIYLIQIVRFPLAGAQQPAVGKRVSRMSSLSFQLFSLFTSGSCLWPWGGGSSSGKQGTVCRVIRQLGAVEVAYPVLTFLSKGGGGPGGFLRNHSSLRSLPLQFSWWLLQTLPSACCLLSPLRIYDGWGVWGGVPFYGALFYSSLRRLAWVPF